MKRLLVLVLTFALSVVSSRAFAQSAQLSGRVVDQSGGVVPHATVVVANDSTGTSRSTDTNESGLYGVSSLVPGIYQVTVRLDGFRPLKRTGVTLVVGQSARLDFTVEPSQTEEAVTVSADASRINMTDGSVGTVVDRKFVENLPMNGRSFQSLILLTPGVATNSPQSSGAAGFSGEFSVNGQRTESNRYSVDGVSANNGTYVFGYSTAGTGGGVPTGTAVGTTQSLVALDALQEFRVSSSSYSAEYGRSPGGQFSFVTRSGTNALHGSLFDYGRNDALDANDWFNNRFQVAKPKEHQNDFGASLGGPLSLPGLYSGRDRTFFFFSYEGLRVQQPVAASLNYVPSIALRQAAPAALQSALNAFPLPTGADLPNGLSEYVMTDSLPSHLDSTSVRVDHDVMSSLRLFFRYSATPSDTVTRSVASRNLRRFSPQSYTVGATSPLSNRLNNEFRIGYSPNEGSNLTTYLNRDGAQPADLFAAQGVDLGASPTAYVLVGLYFPGSSNTVGATTATQQQRQWNITDTVDFIAGQHQFKFGVDFLRTGSDLQRTDPYIYALYNSFDAVVANSAYSASATRYGATHPVLINTGAFVQDEWRIAPRLGLSLGVRWEASLPPSASEGTLPRVLSGSISEPATLALAPEGTAMWKGNYRNIAPRLGLAYVLRDAPDHETVLRAGTGVFFDNGQNLRNAAFDTNPGTNYTKNYGTNFGSAASFPLTPAQVNISTANSLVAPYGTIYQFGDPKDPYELPYTLQWNVSVEQALGAPQSLTISGIGARGRRLLDQQSLSLRALNPNFTSVIVTQSNLTSSYDSLQAQFQRRLHGGLQALASYTWSHAIDEGTDNTALPAKRGNSAFDVRHSFSAALTYELPPAFKNTVAHAVLDRWSLDGRFMARSGYPVTLNGSTLTDPATGQQYYGGLDLVPGVPLYIYRADLPGGRQINPAAFTVPVGSQVGTAPRNFVRGFGATQVDAVLRRDFPLSGAFRLQFRLEAFNIFNHPNFGLVNSTSGNPLFGQATKMLSSSLGGLNPLYQQGGPRSTQVSVRLSF
jgi:hypothetical protein